MWQIILIAGGVGFAFGGLAVYAVSIAMSRTYMRNISFRFQAYESRLESKNKKLDEKDKILHEKTKALREIMHRVHHEGLRPKSATFLGLASLLSPILTELKLNIALCKKPDHHRFGDLAEMQVNELDEVTRRMEIVARDLHSYMGESVKEFEHLQD